MNSDRENKTNSLIVSRIAVDENDAGQITTALSGLSLNNIDCVNWPEDYPSKPKVSFRIAHNSSHLFLHYFVEEDELLAKTVMDNGPVWTDSCVEFFISFDGSPFYYNAEFSCIGTTLLAYREKKEAAEHAGTTVLQSVRRYPSLGRAPFGRKKGDFKWDMLLVIPAKAYWETGISTFDGIRARANFYKCGDDLAVPHFLSWNPIDTRSPDFHVPEFFGELIFE